MDTWKKIVISYYIILVSTTFAVVILDGLEKIDFIEGNITLIITIFSVALAPVAMSALRTKDFWKDDPESVRRIKKDHAKEISDLRKEHSEEISNLRKEHAKAIVQYANAAKSDNETISKHKEVNLSLLAKQKFGNRKPATKPERQI
jgi:hypothetical protein